MTDNFNFQHNVKGHAPAPGIGETLPESGNEPAGGNDSERGGGCCAPSCSLLRSLWFSFRYKNATLHIGENISSLNQMAKVGWRVQKMNSTRVFGERGSFRDYFQAEIINKSILRFFAPKNSHKVIGKTPVTIGGGTVYSNRDQLPSQFNLGGHVPFMGDNDSVKLNEFGKVGVSGYVHGSRENFSANE